MEQSGREALHAVDGLLLTLLPQKAIWIEAHKSMIVSDIHVGKASHFRKNGIPIPQQVEVDNLTILDQLVEEWRPDELFFLGDLFHSVENRAVSLFEQWRSKYLDLHMTLILGNHDILSMDLYRHLELDVVTEKCIDSLWLTHEPQDEYRESSYNLAGHLHPAVTMRGKGKSSLRLPCYYFGAKRGYMPAFGRFTGFSQVVAEKDAHIYVVADAQVMSIYKPTQVNV
jgi:uncharacterized protein